MRTDRIKLVKPTMTLVDEVRKAVVESRAELETYLSWVSKSLEFPEQNMAQAKERHNSFTGELRYYIQQQDDLKVVGAIGLLVRDIEVPFFEIGYWVRTSYSGQGVVSEALGLIEQHAFETLNAKRLEIRMASSNTKSKRVAESAGYAFEGELKNERRLPSGKIANTLIFCKCR